MLKKIIIIILSLVLISILTKAFLNLFKWDVEVSYKKQQWVKILSVETLGRKVQERGMPNTTINNWRAKVRVDDNKIASVNVVYGPVPQQGKCMPVFASYLTNGKVWVVLDVEEWRFGTSNGSCD